MFNHSIIKFLFYILLLINQINKNKMENFKQISIDNFYSKNQDKGGYVQECICCQKEVKNVKYFIHLLTNGNIINTDEDQGDEDQGAFPVGSVCRKKFPKDFIFTYND